MFPIAPLLLLGTLVFTFVNFLRYLSARQWSAVVTQLIAWAAGVIGVFLFRMSDFASDVRIGERTLDQLDVWSALLLGLLATSLLSTLNELKKAVDNSDSAKVPSLLPGLSRTTR